MKIKQWQSWVRILRTQHEMENGPSVQSLGIQWNHHGRRNRGGHRGLVPPQVFCLCHAHSICPVLQIHTVPPQSKSLSYTSDHWEQTPLGTNILFLVVKCPHLIKHFLSWNKVLALHMDGVIWYLTCPEHSFHIKAGVLGLIFLATTTNFVYFYFMFYYTVMKVQCS